MARWWWRITSTAISGAWSTGSKPARPHPGNLRKPEGKIRLLLEAQALAFIAEQAGGYASDGIGDVLDVQPHKLHQRTPLFVGNRSLVEQAEGFIRDYDQDWIDRYRAYRDRPLMLREAG